MIFIYNPYIKRLKHYSGEDLEFLYYMMNRYPNNIYFYAELAPMD